MGDKLVGKHRGVDFYFDEIDGDGGNFGLNDSAQGVGEREVCSGKFKVDVRAVGLKSELGLLLHNHVQAKTYR